MVVSRIYKIQSIFDRMTGLLKKGVVKEKNKPIWYDIYKHFPPNLDPHFTRKGPDTLVREIIYEEDRIRACVDRRMQFNALVDLKRNNQNRKRQILVKKCQQLMKSRNMPVNEAVESAMNFAPK